jgi:anti-sigma regulatory factor (Ser/Thr protein kinase)
MASCPLSGGGTGTVRAAPAGGAACLPERYDSGAGPAVQPGQWPRRTALELAALPTAVPCARLHARAVLLEWQLGHVADDAEILVSELVTNAVKASRSPRGAGLVVLRLLAGYERLLIEAWDENPADPVPCQADYESEGGRGFTVIEAISHRWGYRRDSASLKVVWCELMLIGTGRSAAS